MLFISNQDYRKVDGNYIKYYGVTDSDDMIEEFYNEAQLSDFFFKHRMMILGMTYTGSSFKFKVWNLSMIAVSNVPLHSSFMLVHNGEGQQVLLLNKTYENKFVVWDGYNPQVLEHDKFIRGIYSVRLAGIEVDTMCISDDVTNRLYSSYKEYMEKRNKHCH